MGDEKQTMSAEIIQLLQEIKSDVKEIKSELSKHSEKICELNNKITKLENENIQLKKKLGNTQKEAKRNNLVIFGLKEEEGSNNISQVKALINDIVRVQLCENEIDDVYRIGASHNDKCRPIILKLTRTITKKEILKKSRNLKGTGISIALDLNPEERNIQKIIYQYYKAAKEDNKNAKIVGQKLLINGEVFSYEDLIVNDQEELNKIKEGEDNIVIQENKQKETKKDKEKKRVKENKQATAAEKFTSNRIETRGGKGGTSARET